MIAREVIYRGRVQGVGFRITTREIAIGFAIAGYVRNLDNGDVEVVAEGSAAEVDRFFAALDDRMAANVTDRRVADLAPRGLAGFEIRR